ncbi:MAG: ferrous iron transport protein A [Myxococcota bacterium]
MSGDGDGTLHGLGDVPVGTDAIVRRVEGPRSLRRRLMEMGLLPGTAVRLVRRAPMGDPLELRLRGFSLSLRRRDANAVQVALDVAVDGSPRRTPEAAAPSPHARAAERRALPA